MLFSLANSDTVSIPEEHPRIRELAEVSFYCHYLCPWGAGLSAPAFLACLRLPLCCRKADTGLHPSFSHDFTLSFVVETDLQASASSLSVWPAIAKMSL